MAKMAKKNAGKQVQDQARVPVDLEIPPATNTSDVPSVYANVIEVLAMNFIDVRIAFNEVIIEAGNKATTVRRANIVMAVPAFINMIHAVTANANNLVVAQQQQAREAQAKLQAANQRQAAGLEEAQARIAKA